MNVYSPFSTTAPASGPVYIGGLQPPAIRPMTGPAAGYPAPPPGYGQDRVGVLAAASNTVNNTPLYPIDAVIEDPRMASRLRFFFIGNSRTLLKVGASPFGRSVLSFLGGAIPLFTPSAQIQMIRSNMDTWVYRADLLRAGMDPIQARMLQMAGVMSVPDLARYASPMDQAMLASKLLPIAASLGVQPPSAALIATWVRTAQQLPPVIR